MTDDVDKQQLANDVIATVNALMETMDEPDPEENPMAQMMDPQMLVDTMKPQLYQKVMSEPVGTMESLAVLHRSTGDLLDRHAGDRDIEELAAAGLSDDE